MKKLFLFISLLLITKVFAHEGPPYPILVDQKFLSYKLSVWADPDTGKGTFLFYPEGENLSPNDYIYEIKATPKEENPAEIMSGISLSSVDDKGKFTFTSTIAFNREMIWNVQILVKNKQNGDIVFDRIVPVEVTPPGPNRLEGLLYLIPFVVLGLIWIKVVVRKRKKTPPPE